MKTTALNSENLEGSSETGIQDSSFSILTSHFSPHPPELVPKLRFPEFRDVDGWEEKTIGGVCKLKAGEFVSASDIADALT